MKALKIQCSIKLTNEIGEKLGTTKQSARIFLCNTCCVSFAFLQHSTSQDKLIKAAPNHTEEIKVKGLL